MSNCGPSSPLDSSPPIFNEATLRPKARKPYLLPMLEVVPVCSRLVSREEDCHLFHLRVDFVPSLRMRLWRMKLRDFCLFFWFIF
jgi:hypothetical protein